MIRIALIHPDIPQNTGNVGRLCVGLNTELHLVHPMGFVIDDKKIKRAGLDYWQHLKLIEHACLDDFLKYSEGAGRHFFTTTAARRYTDVAYSSDDFLIFGAESRGLPRDLLERYAQDTVIIPMFGPIRSLNLATSAGIAAYEAVRQTVVTLPACRRRE